MRLFDRMVAQASARVKDMAAALGTDDPQRAWHALRAGLHALRDRLPIGEAARLSAELPLVGRGLNLPDELARLMAGRDEEPSGA